MKIIQLLLGGIIAATAMQAQAQPKNRITKPVLLGCTSMLFDHSKNVGTIETFTGVAKDKNTGFSASLKPTSWAEFYNWAQLKTSNKTPSVQATAVFTITNPSEKPICETNHLNIRFAKVIAQTDPNQTANPYMYVGFKDLNFNVDCIIVQNVGPGVSCGSYSSKVYTQLKGGYISMPYFALGPQETRKYIVTADVIDSGANPNANHVFVAEHSLVTTSLSSTTDFKLLGFQIDYPVR